MLGPTNALAVGRPSFSDYNTGDIINLADTGSSITFKWKSVKDSDHYYFSARLMPEGWELGDPEGEDIGVKVANEEETHNKSGKIKTNKLSANRYLKVAVGAYDREGNGNWTSIYVYLLDQKKPTMTVSTNTKKCSSGEMVTVSFKTKNADHFYYEILDPSGVLRQNGVVNDSVYNVELCPDAEGTWTVTAECTTSVNVVTEGDSSKNGLRDTDSVTIKVEAAPVREPSLSVSLDRETCDRGENVHCSISTKNADHFYYSVKDPNGTELLHDVLHQNGYEFDIPTSVPGTYSVFVRCTTSTDVVVEGDSSQNGLSAEKTLYFTAEDVVADIPELSVWLDRDACTTGASVHCSITTTNADHFYYSVKDPNGTELLHDVLHQNGYEFDIPASVPGTYSVFVRCTTSTDVVVEGDSSQNGLSAEKMIYFTAFTAEDTAVGVPELSVWFDRDVCNTRESVHCSISTKNADHFYYSVKDPNGTELLHDVLHQNGYEFDIPASVAGTYSVFVRCTTSTDVVVEGDSSQNGLSAERTLCFIAEDHTGNEENTQDIAIILNGAEEVLDSEQTVSELLVPENPVSIPAVLESNDFETDVPITPVPETPAPSPTPSPSPVPTPSPTPTPRVLGMTVNSDRSVYAQDSVAYLYISVENAEHYEMTVTDPFGNVVAEDYGKREGNMIPVDCSVPGDYTVSAVCYAQEFTVPDQLRESFTFIVEASATQVPQITTPSPVETSSLQQTESASVPEIRNVVVKTGISAEETGLCSVTVLASRNADTIQILDFSGKTIEQFTRSGNTVRDVGEYSQWTVNCRFPAGEQTASVIACAGGINSEKATTNLFTIAATASVREPEISNITSSASDDFMFIGQPTRFSCQISGSVHTAKVRMTYYNVQYKKCGYSISRSSTDMIAVSTEELPLVSGNGTNYYVDYIPQRSGICGITIECTGDSGATVRSTEQLLTAGRMPSESHGYISNIEETRVYSTLSADTASEEIGYQVRMELLADLSIDSDHPMYKVRYSSASFGKDRTGYIFTSVSSLRTAISELRFTNAFLTPADNGTVNNSLANFCIDASAAAYDNSVSDLIQGYGFDISQVRSYDIASGNNTVGHFLCWRMIRDENGSEIPLFVCIIRGTNGSVREWKSNFNCGMDVNHDGFTIAKTYVMSHLQEYIDNHLPRGTTFRDGKYKLLICGHSRGAAVGNLLARSFYGILEKDLYAYLYATPNTTREPKVARNIHNFCFKNDPIPSVVPKAYGYGKHGLVHYSVAVNGTCGFNFASPDSIEELFMLLYKIFPSQDDMINAAKAAFDYMDINSTELFSLDTPDYEQVCAALLERLNKELLLHITHTAESADMAKLIKYSSELKPTIDKLYGVIKIILDHPGDYFHAHETSVYQYWIRKDYPQ